MILDPIYLYCERTGPSVLAEPLNLAASVVLTGVGVLIWRSAGTDSFLRRFGVGIGMLGLASIALHMVPNRLTVAVTLAAILLLVLDYFHAVSRRVLGLSPVMALVCTLLILPFAAVSLPLIAVLRGAPSSVAYAAMPVLLLGYAVLARPEHPQTARGLSVGAAIMVAAIAARTVDLPLCDRLPTGTHFLWILGVAGLLWHLARVYRAHVLAARSADR